MLAVQPASTRRDGVQTCLAQGSRDLVVGHDLLLPGQEEIPECSRWKVRSLGQKKDLLERRADKRPDSRGPDAGGSSEQGHTSGFVWPDNQYPRPARYVRSQVFEYLMAALGRVECESLVSDASVVPNHRDPRPAGWRPFLDGADQRA